MIGFLGWLAMGLTMISFVFSNMIWLRLVNISACLVWIVYGFLKLDYPVIVTNAMIALIHVFWLIKNKKIESQ